MVMDGYEDGEGMSVAMGDEEPRARRRACKAESGNEAARHKGQQRHNSPADLNLKRR